MVISLRSPGSWRYVRRMGKLGCSQCGSGAHYARGLCNTCWKRAWRQHRLDEHPRTARAPDDTSLADRLIRRGWNAVGDCWEVTGYCNPQGYVYIDFQGRRLTAQRAAYEAWREPIPGNRQVHPICRNTICINPVHLTLRQITRRVCTQRAVPDAHTAEDCATSAITDCSAAGYWTRIQPSRCRPPRRRSSDCATSAGTSSATALSGAAPRPRKAMASPDRPGAAPFPRTSSPIN